MSRDYSWLNRPEDCFAYLEKNFPSLFFRTISFFGPPCSKKTSFASEFVGAQTTPLSDDQNTPTLHFFTAARDSVLTRLASGADASSLWVEDLSEMTQDQLESSGGLKREILVKPDAYRFPPKYGPEKLPEAFDRVNDPRYGTLYINSKSHSGLTAYFQRKLPQALHGDLKDAHLTVLNADLVVGDETRKVELVRTVIIDTKGLDSPSSELPPLPSKVGERVFANSSRCLFFFHPTASFNRRACGDFEQIALGATYPSGWWKLPWVSDNLATAGSALAGRLLERKVCEMVGVPPTNFLQGIKLDKKSQTPNSDHDPAVDLWQKVSFVRAGLDASPSIKSAYQSGGSSLAYFMNFPAGAMVRHVANPHFAAFKNDHERLALEEQNEFPMLVKELESPSAYGQEQLCPMIREAQRWLSQEQKHETMVNARWWGNAAKKVTPYWAVVPYDPCTREKYLEYMWAAQKCDDSTSER